MKILYGVQCSGNGHLSRSREIVAGLRNKGHDVHVILSGRDPALLSDVSVLEPLTAFHGIYYLTSRGSIDYLATAQSLDFARFARDLNKVDASGVDLVVTDFEPITSRVARRNGIPSVAIGHQYSFMFDVPTARGNAIGRAVLKHAAPADAVLPLHWHHFGQPILPPVVPAHLTRTPAVEGKILVYLPFENAADLERILRPLTHWNFVVYGLSDADRIAEHVAWRAFSRAGFLRDLQDCSGVICNAGFELPSEALHLGKGLLVKPLLRQMEQESNAIALKQLDYAAVMQALDAGAIREWLRSPVHAMQITFPDVAAHIVDWLDAGNWRDVRSLLQATWGRDAPKVAAPSGVRPRRAA
jgi:uncharacterized protein (TIGR00661 family)